MRRLMFGLVAAVGVLTMLGPATAGGGGACRGFPVTEARTTTVSMTTNCFEPTIIRIDEGATVTWTNDDPATHAVTGANASWGSFEQVAQGESTSHTFDAPGVYPYYCILHPGMVGAVVVGDAGAAGTVVEPDVSGDSAGVSRQAIAGGAGAAVAVAVGAAALAARVVRRRRE